MRKAEVVLTSTYAVIAAALSVMVHDAGPLSFTWLWSIGLGAGAVASVVALLRTSMLSWSTATALLVASMAGRAMDIGTTRGNYSPATWQLASIVWWAMALSTLVAWTLVGAMTGIDAHDEQ